jgi:hypothetical protein
MPANEKMTNQNRFLFVQAILNTTFRGFGVNGKRLQSQKSCTGKNINN